jgi:hypothetical protein
MQRIFLAFVSIACVIFGSCEKPAAKFHPGDRVFVKDDPKIRGVISMRLSPLNEDLYYIDIPRGAPGSHPFVSEGDEFALIPPTRQYDGAYRASQLELDHQ